MSCGTCRRGIGGALRACGLVGELDLVAQVEELQIGCYAEVVDRTILSIPKKSDGIVDIAGVYPAIINRSSETNGVVASPGAQGGRPHGAYECDGIVSVSRVDVGIGDRSLYGNRVVSFVRVNAAIHNLSGNADGVVVGFGVKEVLNGVDDD